MARITGAFAWRVVVLGMAGVLASCGSLPEQWEEGRKYQAPGVTPLRPLAQTTAWTLAKDFATEPQGGTPVAIGLALSGGGTRAAMFAHGVLQGLNDSGVLGHLDAISTVSGGSYTALWYYTKRLEMQKAGLPYQAMFDDCVPLWWEDPPPPGDKDFATRHKIRKALELAGQGNDGFKKMAPCLRNRHFRDGDPYRWQVHLARWPDIFRYSETIPNGDGQDAPWSETIKLALTSFGEILISPLVKTGVVPSAYQYGIERAWGLNPNPRSGALQDFSYTNDIGGKPQTSGWHMDPDKATWQQLRALHDLKGNGKLPLWILNASNAPRGMGTDQSRIFEITAFGHGSELTGYLRNGEAVIPDLGTSVRASAAAVDAQGAGEKYAQSLSARNFLFPLAEWGETVDNVFQESPKSFRLSDGGHSENLGVYSLMRRGARDVIVVDAAEDVEGRMADLCTLRSMLQKENVTLTFSGELSQLDAVCEGAIGSTTGRPRGYNTSAWLNPVVPGQAIWPPESGLPPTRIWLIKLGWNQQAVRRAFNAEACETPEHPVSCLISAYYGHNTATVRPKDKLMYFPQLTTPGAGFSTSTYLFWAYRELGRTAASALKVQGDGTLALQPKVALNPQPALCVRPKLRPEPC